MSIRAAPSRASAAASGAALGDVLLPKEDGQMLTHSTMARASRESGYRARGGDPDTSRRRRWQCAEQFRSWFSP
jgi:hypothetical protein